MKFTCTTAPPQYHSPDASCVIVSFSVVFLSVAQHHGSAPWTAPPRETAFWPHTFCAFLLFLPRFVCPCVQLIQDVVHSVASQQESCGFESQPACNLLLTLFLTLLSHFMFLPLYLSLLRAAPEYLIILNYRGPQP